MLKVKNKKAPTKEATKTTKFILKHYDDSVKRQYEIIDLIERAKEVSRMQLACMIQEAREEIGTARVIAKLETIMNERFGYA